MSKVIILGGGVAGLSAAHELIERGFEVHVYEKKPRYLGGKARSVAVPDSATDDHGPLPGEHGFRFFPGFYRHITDTMKRIPFTDAGGRANPNGVYDNLVEVDQVGIMREQQAPIVMGVCFPTSRAAVKRTLAGIRTLNESLQPGEGRAFAEKLWQLMTSCRDRRDTEYEGTGWWQFTGADQHSPAYSHLLVEGLTRTLVAANARVASTKTGGNIFLQLLFNIVKPLTHTDRVLNGPTNEAWLIPWENYLRSKGVQFHRGALVERVVCKNGAVAGVVIKDWQKALDAAVGQGGKEADATNRAPAAPGPGPGADPFAYDPPAAGDFYILATPVEVAAAVLPPELKGKSGSLRDLDELARDVAWMNGIQFYLNETIGVAKAHHIHVDSRWALTSISQLPYWPGYDIARQGNGQVKTILSVDISNWEALSPEEPGLPPLQANQCHSYDQIADRVWAQLKASLRDGHGTPLLRDEMRVLDYQHPDSLRRGYYLDHSINLEALQAGLEPATGGPAPGGAPPAAGAPASSGGPAPSRAARRESTFGVEALPSPAADGRPGPGRLSPGAGTPATPMAAGLKGANPLKLVNYEPLLVNTINSWALRPNAAIPEVKNLFLASDYVRTNTDLATMEGANEAARRAVNALIDAAGVQAAHCRTWRYREPVALVPFKWYDRWRYRSGAAFKPTPRWFNLLMTPWLVACGLGFGAQVAYYLLRSRLGRGARPAAAPANRRFSAS